MTLQDLMDYWKVQFNDKIFTHALLVRKPNHFRKTKTVFRVLILIASLSVSTASLAADAAEDAYIHGDYTTAFALWRPRAVGGEAQAQALLGSLYAFGRGTPKDDGQAMFWLRKSAEQNNAGGQLAVGEMYLQGRGADADAKQGAFWIEKAAEQGLAPAELFLGTMYEGGIGVAKDVAKANYWNEKANHDMQPMEQMIRSAIEQQPSARP